MAVQRRVVGVEVIGVPDLKSNERTVDKLLIHFLRPRNGGGEVQRVLYPLHTPGHALIIYEDPNVADRVLQKRHHELEVGDQTFPLEVKPGDPRKLDHPVEATVNLNAIADVTEPQRLLHRYGFEVIGWDEGSGWARVKGSMMMLRPFMAETHRLLRAQSPNLTRPSSSSSPPLGGLSPPAAVSRNSTHGRSARAKQTPSWSTEAPPYGSPPPSPSPTSFGTSSSSPAVDPVVRRRPTPTPEESPIVSFFTNSEVLQYAQSYKKLGIQDILAHHNAKIDVTTVVTDVKRVVVTGWRPREASAELQHLLSDVGETLRFRDVPLGGLDHDAQVGVAKRIQELKCDFPMVLILQKGDAILLVGPRVDCELLKEAVLQERPAEWQERRAESQERPEGWQERRAESQERPEGWQERPAELQSRAGRSRRKEKADEKAKEVKRRSWSAPRILQADGRGEAAGGAGPTSPASLNAGGPTSPASLNAGPSWPRARDEGGRDAALTNTEETANHGGPGKTNLKPAKSPAVRPSLLPDVSRMIPKFMKKNKHSEV